MPTAAHARPPSSATTAPGGRAGRRACRRIWRAAGAPSVLALTIFAAAAAAAVPAATTGPTTAVGASTATVTGVVNPGGKATTWRVEYGTSTTYGSTTSSTSA